MKQRKIALIAAVLLGLLAGGHGRAGAPDGEGAAPVPAEAQAYAGLPFCTLSADGKHLARQPCRTAPAQRPMPRRPVTQIIEPMPSRAAPPRLAPPSLPPSAPLRTPSPPQPLGNCGVGGCYDAGGVWQGNGVGNTSVVPNGKLCQRNGIWLQCF
ncbi:hypothetical protein ACFOLJ_01515 [Rugamonas sp. CCM 8940]|uniref:hypothetical protein n=1 Tax=Rugamonas sp. CCM 8940 TaxID=2765359 RepID=UPI0018F365CC|nr:hypothetical protein [Rugamonas sp. CCM 8940]MBJ7308700.1 hypothetical protein [Rugamonas sp. CCM 8940]